MSFEREFGVNEDNTHNSIISAIFKKCFEQENSVVEVPRRLAIQTFLAATASLPFSNPKRLFAQGGAPDAGILQTPKKTISKAKLDRFFELGKRRVGIVDRSILQEGPFTFRTDELKIDHQKSYVLVTSKDGKFCAKIGERGDGIERKKVDFGFVPPGEIGGESGILGFRIYRPGPGFERHRIRFDAESGEHLHEVVPIAELDNEYTIAQGFRGKGPTFPKIWAREAVEEKGWYSRLYNYSGTHIGNGGAEFGGYKVEFVRKENAVAFSFIDSNPNPPNAFWEFEGGVAPILPGKMVRGERGLRRYFIVGKTIEEVKKEAGVWIIDPRNLGAFSAKKCVVLSDSGNVVVFHNSGAGYGMMIMQRERIPTEGAGLEMGAVSRENEGQEEMGYLIEGDIMRIAIVAKNAESGSEVSLLSVSGNGETLSEWAVLE